MSDLDAHIAGPSIPDSIDDDEQARRLAWRRHMLAHRLGHIRAQAERHRADVLEWETREAAPVLADIERVDHLLVSYLQRIHDTERAAGRKRLTPSLVFPGASVRATQTAHGLPPLRWENDADTLAWAVADGHTDLYVEKPYLKRSAFDRERFKALPGEPGEVVEVVDATTGEPVPGLRAELIDRTYKVVVE